MTEFDDLLTVRQAAAVCGRSVETVRRWIAAGRLPARKLGAQFVVRRQDALRLCAGVTDVKQERLNEADLRSMIGEHYGTDRSVEEQLAAIDLLEEIGKSIAERNGGASGLPKAVSRETEEENERIRQELEWLDRATAHTEAVRSEIGGTLDVMELVRQARGE